MGVGGAVFLLAVLLVGARGIAAAQAGVTEHAAVTPGVTVVTDQTGGEVSLKERRDA